MSRAYARRPSQRSAGYDIRPRSPSQKGRRESAPISRKPLCSFPTAVEATLPPGRHPSKEANESCRLLLRARFASTPARRKPKQQSNRRRPVSAMVDSLFRRPPLTKVLLEPTPLPSIRRKEKCASVFLQQLGNPLDGELQLRELLIDRGALDRAEQSFPGKIRE